MKTCLQNGLTIVLLSSAIALASAQSSHPVAAPGHAKTAIGKPGKPAASTAPPAAKPAEKPVTVTVRPNCDVTGPAFTLGEIAEIQGEDSALTAQLAAVEIGASPLPGLSRIINPGDITVRLRQHHLDSARIDVALPPGIRITRSGHDIAADEITRAAIESARDAIKNLPDATLEPVTDGAKFVVPAGKSQILAGAWRGNPESGNITVPVSIAVDGKAVRMVDVVLRIHRKIMVLVASHDVQLHEVLGPGDVALMAVDLKSGPEAPITAFEDALGKRATRRIAANAPISASMLEKAPLIAANDAVTIEFIYGALRVTAAGVARQAGAEGDTIHVYATDTKRELDGIVIDKHIVRVEDGSN
jgi:flagella basal body P-ring formation protein FlgA